MGAVVAPAGLLVYVRGLSEDKHASDALITRLVGEERFRGWATFVHPRMITPFERGNLGERGNELAEVIDQHWRALGRPAAIVLIGHSLGGLMARHAYLAGLAEQRPDRWADRVQRIALLAAPNRGFEPRRLPAFRRWAVSAALAVPPLARRFVATDAIVGAPYLADLRLRWIDRMTAPDAPRTPVVQIVGYDDPLITFEDSIDLESMPGSRTIGIAFADHDQVVEPRSKLDCAGEQCSTASSMRSPAAMIRRPESRRLPMRAPSRTWSS